MSTVARTAPDVAFETSGQSGHPVTWVRTQHQLDEEAALLARTLVGTVDEVVSFAPASHLYGRLLGEELPRYLRVPVQRCWEDPLALPTLNPDRRTLLVCLPSSWLTLRSVLPQLRGMSVVAVHGTGPTVPATREVIAALDGPAFTAFEVFGSTETGGVAYRPLTGGRSQSDAWRLFDDVTVVGDRGLEQRLAVRSARLARRSDMARLPAELATDDIVRPLDGEHLQLLGRSSRLAKVNGVRFQLERVESILGEAFPHAEFTCVLTTDHVRAEHYELYYVCDETIPVSDLHVRLGRAAPKIPMPRDVRRVDSFRRSSVGKVQLSTSMTACGVV